MYVILTGGGFTYLESSIQHIDLNCSIQTTFPDFNYDKVIKRIL